MLTWWLLLLVLPVALSLFPLGALFADAVAEGHWAVASSKDFPWDVLRNTLLLCLATASLTTALGVTAGSVLGSGRFPGRMALRLAVIVPLLIPPYIHAVGWTYLVRNNGFAWHVATKVLRLPDDWLAKAAYSLPGAALVLSLALFPIAALFTEKALNLVPASLVEATRINGGSSWHVWQHALWPAIRPAAVSAGMIVFLLTGAELGVPTVLRVDVFNFEVFTELSAFNDVRAATLLSIPMLVTGILVVFSDVRLGGDEEQERGGAEGSFETSDRVIPLHMVLATLAIVCVALLPLGTLIFSAADSKALAEMTRLAARPAYNTVLYVLVAGCLAIVLSLLLSFVLLGEPSGKRRLTDLCLMVGFAVPGTILALGLLAVYGGPSISQWISAPILVVGALLARYQIIAYRGVSQSVYQIPKELFEAARMEGAAHFQVLRHVVLPAIGGPALTVLAVFLVLGFNEIGTTILLYPPGGETLSIAMYSIEANSPRAYGASLAVISVAFEAVCVGVIATGGGLLRSRGK